MTATGRVGRGVRARQLRVVAGATAAMMSMALVAARPADAASSGITLMSAPADEVESVSVAAYGVRVAWSTSGDRAYVDDDGLNRTLAIAGPGGTKVGVTEPVVCVDGGPSPADPEIGFVAGGEVWVGGPGSAVSLLEFDVPGLTPQGRAAELDATYLGCRYRSTYSRWVDDGEGVRLEVFVWTWEPLGLSHTRRVSIDRAGGSPNGGSWEPSIARGEGRHVAFTFEATDLVAGDTNGWSDVFVRDLQTSTTRLVSVDRFGGPADGDSSSPFMSATANFVAFTSSATDLVAGDSNGQDDVFVRDLRTGMTRLASVDRYGGPANGASGQPSISGDGRYVAFTSDATDLTAGDTNGSSDVFIRDLQTGTTRLVTRDRAGGPANGESFAPEISADGWWIAFLSSATDLVSGSLAPDQARAYTAPNGPGYRLALDEGDVYAFGAAHFHGDADITDQDFPRPCCAGALNKPIEGMAATASGRGYWLVATDGGIFSFGDARFLGSLAGYHDHIAIVSLTATPW